MPGLGETVSELMLQRMREAALRPAPGPTPLVGVQPIGANPGDLDMLSFVPPGLPPGAALVVVLHGCTQDAAGYDAGAGWSELARRHGFALLYPQQPGTNNAGHCFNWFQPEDVTRGRGEVASIANMIQQMVATHGLNPARVYITGLSAGGAMAAAMLATYPELFAGGAIIAGLPFGAATSVHSAIEAMRQVRSRPAAAWGGLVRRASAFVGRRPPVQIWHGAADTTVHPVALEESARQWCDVAGTTAGPVTDTVDGVAHQAWQTPDCHVAVETFLVPGLGHGVPLHREAADLDESVGTPSRYMLECAIGSTPRIARSWSLLTQPPLLRGQRSNAKASAAPGLALGGLFEKMARRAGLPR